MKLEIKHLAPYLPYGLKAKFQAKNKKTCRKYVIGTISVMYSDCSICCYDTVNATPDNFKPILRSLSDYADINSDAMNSLNCDMSDQIQISELASKRISLSDISVGCFDILVSNHVDVFGLIDEGLALPLMLGIEI
jgi:hypothetical protein